MVSLISPTEFHTFFETDLSDVALQAYIDSEQAEIERRYGTLAAQTQLIKGGTKNIFTAQPYASIASITEDDVILATDDWQAINPFELERLDSGTNGLSFWGDDITIVYTPQTDTARRKRVLIDLVKLACQFNGLSSQSLAGYSYNLGGYTEQREKLLRQLRRGLQIV